MRTIEREKAPHQQDAEICFAFVRDLSPNIKHIVNKQRILIIWYRKWVEAGAPIQLHNNQQID